MNLIKSIILSVILILFCSPIYALPAFPGAEGMGASSVGGRGGTIYMVTNLDNSGPGSFRAACEATGPRIVVFRVSGHIRLSTTLFVNNPFITIAGQTSPGGVDVSGGMFCISTHDVVVTHMRFRMSSDVCDGIASPAVGNCATYGDSVRVMGVAASGNGEAYNVVFDHCSMSWGNDETLDMGGYMGNTRDVVISWCMIAQGLDDPAPESNHGYGITLGSHYQSSGQIKVSLHHNYIAHFRDRVPYVVYNGFCDARNNVVYNWGGSLSMQVQYVNGYNNTKANFVHNYTKSGSLSNSCASGYSKSVFFCGTGSNCHTGSETPYPALYVAGNLACNRTSQTDDEWTVINGWSPFNILSTAWRSSTPLATTDIPVTTTTMSVDYVQTILAGAGATKPSRDTVDTGFVNDFSNGTGSTLADNHYPTRYPTFSTPAAPTDADNDGMADAWEVTTFGSTAATASGDADGDGYTNIEEYLHYLGGYTSGQTTDTTPPATPTGVNATVIQ